MRKIVYLISLSFLLLCLSGCLKTLYPIFHTKDALYNESLLGYWKCTDKEKKISYIEYKKIPADKRLQLTPAIQKISDKGYFVSRINSLGEITNQYFVFLVKIGRNFYLDYYPAEMSAQKNVNKFYKDHCVNTHTSYRLDFKDNDHFEIRMFDQYFLDKLISDNKINVRHEVIESKNIITASTDDLQKFIIKYGDNPAAFGGNITYCSRIIDY